MALALRSLHDLPSATGVIDRRYPLGDAPVISQSNLGIDKVAFKAAAYNLLQLASNQTFDFNYRQFLTGSSAATAVLSINAASGSLGNWRIDASGNGISIATGANGGSGSLFVSATNGVDTVTFDVQVWSAVAVAQQGQIKLVVGNGWWTDNQFWSGATGAAAQEKSNFDNYFPLWSANPLSKYFYMSLTWGACEGPTRGDYSKAFAAIDYALAKCATAGHKFGVIVEIWQTFFNTFSLTDLASWPQYVVNNNWIIACIAQGAKRTQPKWDIDDLWSAFGDMCQAICDRYNSHPLFYGFSTMDESVAISIIDSKDANGNTVTQPNGLSPGQTILDSAHYNAKFLELQLRLLARLSNTPLYVPLNYLPPGGSTEAPTMANMINTIEAQYPKHAIYGGPDPFVRQTTFQKLVAGVYQSTTGMADIRKNILLMNRVQEAFLGNTKDSSGNLIKPGNTPQQLYDNAVQNNAVMLTWNHQTWEYYKYADEIAAIQARNGVVGTPPAGGSYTII